MKLHRIEAYTRDEKLVKKLRDHAHKKGKSISAIILQAVKDLLK